MKLIVLISLITNGLFVWNGAINPITINKYEKIEQPNLLNMKEIFKFYTDDFQIPYSKSVHDLNGVWKISVNLTKNEAAGIKIYDNNNKINDAYVFKYKFDKKDNIEPIVEDFYKDTEKELEDEPVNIDRNTNDLIIENLFQAKTYITITAKRHINTYDDDDIIIKPGDENISFEVKVCTIDCVFAWLYSNNDKKRKLNDFYKIIYMNKNIEDNKEEAKILNEKSKDVDITTLAKEIISETKKSIDEKEQVQLNISTIEKNSSDNLLTNVGNMIIDTKNYIENKYPRIMIYFGLCVIILGIILVSVGCSLRNCKDTQPDFEKQLNEIEEQNSPSIYYQTKKNKYKLID